jgi:poly(A) polymerase
VTTEKLIQLLVQPKVARLMTLLNPPGEETRIIGGAIRNSLLGLESGDIDLATTLLPEQVIALAQENSIKAVPTGLAHGTLTLVLAGEPFEITTLREDITTDGRHAEVKFGRDFVKDALRRDFTINALSLDKNGQIHDITQGQDDLEKGIVRFIGNPENRIIEDYLRILRFFRFHACYGRNDHEQAALKAILKHQLGLSRLSRERVRAEFLKILLAPQAFEALDVMQDAGILTHLLGGVVQLGRFDKIIKFEQEVGVAPDAITRLAALAVFTLDDTQRLTQILRLSRQETNRLERYVTLYEAMRRHPHTIRAFAALAKRQTFFYGAWEGEPALCLTLEDKKQLRQFSGGQEPIPIFPLKAADLITRGVPGGRTLGSALSHAQALWLKANCPLDKDSLNLIIEKAIQDI